MNPSSDCPHIRSEPLLRCGPTRRSEPLRWVSSDKKWTLILSPLMQNEPPMLSVPTYERNTNSKCPYKRNESLLLKRNEGVSQYTKWTFVLCVPTHKVNPYYEYPYTRNECLYTRNEFRLIWVPTHEMNPYSEWPFRQGETVQRSVLNTKWTLTLSGHTHEVSTLNREVNLYSVCPGIRNEPLLRVSSRTKWTLNLSAQTQEIKPFSECPTFSHEINPYWLLSHTKWILTATSRQHEVNLDSECRPDTHTNDPLFWESPYKVDPYSECHYTRNEFFHLVPSHMKWTVNVSIQTHEVNSCLDPPPTQS